jgi:hypothetical protein
MLAVYLIITVAVAFLFAAVDPIHSFEIGTPGAISGACYIPRVMADDILAVLPQAGQSGNTLSPFRMISLRFFILFGIYALVTAVSRSSLGGKIQANLVNKKNSILLKLRI